jgi:ribosomal protein L37AE/L43A
MVQLNYSSVICLENVWENHVRSYIVFGSMKILTGRLLRGSRGETTEDDSLWPCGDCNVHLRQGSMEKPRKIISLWPCGDCNVHFRQGSMEKPRKMIVSGPTKIVTCICVKDLWRSHGR